MTWTHGLQFAISIHAPRMGSDGFTKANTKMYIDFNPRSPHGERLLVTDPGAQARQFQSTLPAWGATDNADEDNDSINISIHAPRMGSDKRRDKRSNTGSDFNPRSPHGERPSNGIRCRDVQYFNPRSPHGERPPLSMGFHINLYFNPRSPHGERQYSQSIQQ